MARRACLAMATAWLLLAPRTGLAQDDPGVATEANPGAELQTEEPSAGDPSAGQAAASEVGEAGSEAVAGPDKVAETADPKPAMDTATASADNPNQVSDEPAAVEESMPAVDDDDDDFDSDSGPVDHTPRLSGVLQASNRLTWFGASELPDKTPLRSKNQFQLEHTHVKIAGDLTNKLSYEVMPCITHMNSFSVITANFAYNFGNYATVTAGRFLLPFGQFNQRSVPGTYTTISRPLLYTSHEDDALSYGGALPVNLFYTPRDDLGLMVNGSVWFLDSIQLSYSLAGTNGLRPESAGMNRFWDDNNFGKQADGRLSLSYNGDLLSAGVGASGLINQYATTQDDRALNQVAYAIDAALSLNLGEGRSVNLRGEWVDMNREIVPTDTLQAGDEEVSGAYLTLDAMLMSWIGIFGQLDMLTNRTPQAQYNEQFRDETVSTYRVLGGLTLVPVGPLAVRLEYAHWFMPDGLPAADRLSAQTVVTF